MNSHSHTIDDADDGIRLDRWFKRHYPDLPHAMLEKHLRKGEIRLAGKKAKSSDRVEAGQEIGIRAAGLTIGQIERKTKPVHLHPDDVAFMKSLVLHKDANIMVINKPYGLSVQGGSKVTRSIDGMLDALMFEAPERPKLVHRLDRDTSGVLVLARSSKVAAKLAALFSEGKSPKSDSKSKTIDKTYLALVHGAPTPPVGTIELPVVKKAGSPTNREQMVVDEDEGKYALTHYRTLDSLARQFALVALTPVTGRTHQLRVHMAEIGCPIVGDPKYGYEEDAKERLVSLGVAHHLHLHAFKLVIPSLEGAKPVTVTAPLPEHMMNSFTMLGIEIKKGW